MNQWKNRDLRSIVDSLTPEEIEAGNRYEMEEADRQYAEFLQGLKENKCYICGKDINSFNLGKFCLHWFCKPEGLQKRYYEKHLNNKELSFFCIESFFRWLASTENPIKNISDLKDEMSESSYFEATYRYKNIEWSFSIGHTDKEGHAGALAGERPHYHIQMMVDNKPFIQFNDLHILFTDEDLFNFEFFKQNKERSIWNHSHGFGISVLENETVLEALDNLMHVTDDEENATFHTSTLIQAPEGQFISLESLKEAYQKSKETGKPVSHFMKDLAPEAQITKFIFPGDGVPEIARRSGKK